MQKYKRPLKYSTVRSIPLRNPRKVDWNRWNEDDNTITNFRPKPVDPPSFVDPYLLKKLPPEPPAKFVLMHQLDTYRVLWMYWLGRTYWFVEHNCLTRRNWRSSDYDGRDEAMYYYNMEISGRRVIRWKLLGES